LFVKRFAMVSAASAAESLESLTILRELKIRGLARRILVVAPAGLVLQWQSEMKTHFNEDFRLILRKPAWLACCVLNAITRSEGWVAVRAFPEKGDASRPPSTPFLAADRELEGKLASEAETATSKGLALYIVPGTVSRPNQRRAAARCHFTPLGRSPFRWKQMIWESA
jgi:hypothetical protein